MFGRLRGYYLRDDKFSREQYRAVYCGACYALADKIGLKGRLILSYEIIAAFALATSLVEKEQEKTGLNCPLSGFGKKDRYIFKSSWVEKITDLYLYLIWLKTVDDVDDEKGIKRFLASLVQKNLLSDISGIRQNLLTSGFPLDSAEKLINERNNQNFSYLDETLETSAELFRIIGEYFAGIIGRVDLKSKIGNAGASLGRCIDLVDMIEDLKDDISGNRFNPLVTLYSNGRPNKNKILDNARDDLMYLSNELCCDLAVNLAEIPLERNHELVKGVFGRSIEKCFADNLNIKPEKDCPLKEILT